MDDSKNAPVVLPAGSFEIEDLQKKLDSAAGKKDRDAAVADAITAAQVDAPAVEESGTVRGLKSVEVEHAEIEGLVERTQVLDPKAKVEDTPPPPPPVSSADATEKKD